MPAAEDAAQVDARHGSPSTGCRGEEDPMASADGGDPLLEVMAAEAGPCPRPSAPSSPCFI